MPVTAQMVRDYLQATGTTGQWSNAMLGSNAAAASQDLSRWTSRQFEWQGSNTRKVFTTNGAATVQLPGLIRATSVTLQNTALEADSTYWLIPDRMNTGVYTAIQVRPFGRGRDYRSNPEWFDRNLDSDYWRYTDHYSLPNDLAITGEWGHLPEPDAYLLAAKALAAFYTIRVDANLAGAKQTPEGNVFDLSRLPLEVTNFVEGWRLRQELVAI